MTITELRKQLEKLEEKGKGEYKIEAVSFRHCEPISEALPKYTTDIELDIDESDKTLLITD